MILSNFLVLPILKKLATSFVRWIASKFKKEPGDESVMIPQKFIIPPFIRYLIVAIVCWVVGAASVWFYKDAVIRADQAEITVEIITKGEESASKSRVSSDKELSELRELKEEVNTGEKKIVAPDGKHFTREFSDLLRSKVNKDSGFANRSNP